MRFDGIEISIFSLFSYILPNLVSYQKLDITYGYNIMNESNLWIMYWNLNAQKTKDFNTFQHTSKLAKYVSLLV